MPQIIDGRCDEPNVYAEDIGQYNIAMFGAGDYVFPVGNQLGYEMASNNEINIKDGLFITQGRRGIIKRGIKEKCVIENGIQGRERNDIIVMEYRKDAAKLTESHTLKVLKGTSGSTASDPKVTTGNIPAGDYVHQMPLYRVRLSGINVVAVEQLFTKKELIQSVELDEAGKTLYLTVGD